MDDKPKGEPIPIPTSTQKSLSSAHDSGWNDPPKWAYSQSPNASTTPTKRVLNKRVAFPLGSTPPASNFDPNQPLTPPPANMPPPPLTAVRLTTGSNQGLKTENAEAESSKDTMGSIGKEQAISDSLENFEKVINENEELKSRAEDIRRRLNLLKTAWMEDKLEESIQRKVLELSNALRKKDVESADKIHVNLMMDHAATCSSWIPGIRHMILAIRGKQAQENQPLEENPSPYLLPCEKQEENV